MPLIPKQIPSYFTDHAVTLAFPARSLCVRTPLIISLSLFPVCHHQPPARPWPSRPVQLTKMLLAALAGDDLTMPGAEDWAEAGTVASLYIYPVKSMAGVRVNTFTVDETGPR